MRLAAKAGIPHVDDHVSKLEAVGKETRNKLEDINAAAACMGVYGVTVPRNSVTTGARTCLRLQGMPVSLVQLQLTCLGFQSMR